MVPWPHPARDVTDEDQPEVPSDPRRPLVHVIASLVLDPFIDGSDEVTIVGSLRDREFLFQLSIVARRLDLKTGRERRQRREAEIDPDRTRRSLGKIFHFDVEADPPATASVLDEAAALRSFRERPALRTEETVFVAKVGHRAGGGLTGLFTKGNPAK